MRPRMQGKLVIDKTWGLACLKGVNLNTPLATLVIALAVAQSSAEQRSALKLSASFEDGGSQIELTWLNEGGPPCLLNVGTLFGTVPLYHFALFVSGAGMSDRSRASIGRSSAIEGRPDPWVVYMPVGAAYGVRIPVGSIMLSGSGKPLDSVKGPWTLTIQQTGEAAVDFAPGGRGKIPYSLSRSGPTAIPFCEGVSTARLERK